MCTEGDPGQAIAIMALAGIPIGAQFLTNSILADVIDYDEFLNGSRSEGSFRWAGPCLWPNLATPLLPDLTFLSSLVWLWSDNAVPQFFAIMLMVCGINYWTRQASYSGAVHGISLQPPK